MSRRRSRRGRDRGWPITCPRVSKRSDLRKRGNRVLYSRGEPGGPARADRGIPTARPSGSPLLGRSAVLQGRGEGLHEPARVSAGPSAPNGRIAAPSKRSRRRASRLISTRGYKSNFKRCCCQSANSREKLDYQCECEKSFSIVSSPFPSPIFPPLPFSLWR